MHAGYRRTAPSALLAIADEVIDEAALMTCAAGLGDLFRRLAAPIADILKGKQPQDIPFDRPTKFELIINLKTAKSQGIDVPHTLMRSSNRTQLLQRMSPPCSIDFPSAFLPTEEKDAHFPSAPAVPWMLTTMKFTRNSQEET